VLVAVIVAMPVVIAIALGRPATIDPDRVPVGDPRSYWTSVIVLALVVSLPANRDPALRSFRLSRRRTSSTPVRPLAASEPR
jgi:hypothetical protein